MERSLNTFDANGNRKYPGFGGLFQMLTEGEADAKLLMTQLSKNLDRGWLSLAYTLADRQNTSDSWNDFIQAPLDPAVTDFSSLKARAAWDERHRVVATGGRDYPFGLSVSGKLVYASGRPYSAITIDDANGDGRLGNDRPAGEARNGREGPNFLRADLGLGWSFDVANGRQIGLQLNVYNVLNRTNLDPATVATDINLPTFGQAALAFHKRLAEIGLTIR